MPHRNELAERLATIPNLLAERPYTQKELAEYFSVSQRTIRRALVNLIIFWPIVEERRGRELIYRYLPGYQYRAPAFTLMETATLLLAQQAIAATGLADLVSPLAQSARSLLAKVRQSLPDSLQQELAALAQVFGSAAVPAKDFAPYAETIWRLTKAALAGHRVRLVYYTLKSDTERERLVDPLAVYFDPDGATLKLIAFDHHRQARIPFAIDHIRALTVLPERFPRPPFNLADELAETCFNGIHGPPVLVQLRVYGVTARVFAERTFHRSQRLLEQTPESVTLEMRVAGGRGLERFILSWTPEIEVLAPPELRHTVAALHEQARRRYEVPPT